MKKFFKREKYTFGELKSVFALLNFAIDEESFDKMTYSELNKLLKKARKSYFLRAEVYKVIDSKSKDKK